MATSHHFVGLKQYAEHLPVFKGRGEKPSNKEVLKEIAKINNCKQASFFELSSAAARRPCSCGWHTKAAARRKKRQSAASSSTSYSPSVSVCLIIFSYVKCSTFPTLCKCMQQTIIFSTVKIMQL